MTPGEFREYCKVMAEFGIKRTKMGNVEIILGEEKEPIPEPGPFISNFDPKKEDVISHKVEELSNLLKMDDRELVDQLFPDHTEDVNGL